MAEEHLSLRRPVSAESLAAFIRKLKGPLSKSQECRALSTAIPCSGDIWLTPVVREAVQATGFASEPVGVILDLMSTASLAPHQRINLGKLFKVRSAHLLKEGI